MKRLASAILCPVVALLAVSALGGEINQAEVLRLGNVVQAVGGGPRAAEVDAYVEALAPPATDNDKWFISVLTMKGCGGCEKLKQEWATNQWLLALANPNNPKESWAHYNVYLREDKSQQFRFEGLQVTAYPTILVQPPRSGKYGDPKTVVFQAVYNGDPKQLATDMANAIRRYVSRVVAPAPVQTLAGVGQYGVDPPWSPAPRLDPFVAPVTPNFPQVTPLIPPQPAPTPTVEPFPWGAVVTLMTAGFSVPAAIGLTVWLVSFIRAKRLAAGKQPLVDQATLDEILSVLKQFSNTPKPPANS